MSNGLVAKSLLKSDYEVSIKIICQISIVTGLFLCNDSMIGLRVELVLITGRGGAGFDFVTTRLVRLGVNYFPVCPT